MKLKKKCWSKLNLQEKFGRLTFRIVILDTEWTVYGQNGFSPRED